MSAPNTNPREVIEGRVKKNALSGCWDWDGATGGSAGYGIFRIGGKKVYAHRAAYESYVGAIPGGHEVCHRCDNPGCVNPEHLFVGTHKENMRDMSKKGRMKHALSPDVKKAIRHLYFAERRGQSEIARYFGISQAGVYGIVSPPQPKPSGDSTKMKQS